MIKFSVLVPTYNRHKLVIHTLRSLLAQTYTNFEILLFDNGSNPPVYDAVVREFNDNRIKFRRYEENIDVNDLGEEALNQMSGTHFLWLADDDALVPTALEIAANVFALGDGIDLLFVGFANFKHGADLQPGVWSCPNELNSFSGLLEELNAEETGLYFCNFWGIGSKHNYKGPRMMWPSSVFLSRRLIDVTRKRQGELFIKPMGDAGYVGACFNAEKVYYLDLPLSVVGDSAVRASVFAKPGMRRQWEKQVRWLEHTPIRGVSHTNLCVDIHLKTLYRNGLNKKYDCRLRPDFYYRHLAQVVSDSPWTKVTVRDMAECLPHLIISHYQFFSVRNTIRGFYQLPFWVVDKIYTRLHNNKGIEFENIYDFAVWVDDNHMKRTISGALNGIPGKILRGLKDPILILWWLRNRLPYHLLIQPRLALNYVRAGTPRVYYMWAYNAGAHHPSFKTYDVHPPVHYTLYSLADICHFWNSVPGWNKKPFVVEFEHVLALGELYIDWQRGLRRIKYIEGIIASDRCRVALTLSKGLINHSKRYISDPSLHDKFDYLYPCYPTQKPRVMDLSGPFTILSIAARFYDKGVPVALKVFEVLRERYGNQVRMILVCDCLPKGYPIPDGVTILTVRPLSNTLKAKLYSNSHVLFLPVLSDTLGCFPEAYAYGTPVVTTRIHHGDETVREGVTGFLVDPPFYCYSDGFGTRWKSEEDFMTDCKQSYETGVFNDLINQCTDRLGRMISGNVDLRKMSAAAQTFHREIFSTEVRNERLRQIYRRVAGL